MLLALAGIVLLLAITHGTAYLVGHARGYDRCYERWKLVRAAERGAKREPTPEERASTPVRNKAIQATIDELQRPVKVPESGKLHDFGTGQSQ